MDNALRLWNTCSAFSNRFRAQADLSVVSKLDLLIDIEQLRDARVVPFMLEVLSNDHEPIQVRVHVLKRLRDRSLTNALRQAVANAMLGLLVDGCPPQLRLQAALALGEFTDIDGVPVGLGAIAGDPDLPLDIRYSAFTALERAGPTPECVALLRQLLSDHALGGLRKESSSVLASRGPRVTFIARKEHDSCSSRTILHPRR